MQGQRNALDVVVVVVVVVGGGGGGYCTNILGSVS